MEKDILIKRETAELLQDFRIQGIFQINLGVERNEMRDIAASIFDLLVEAGVPLAQVQEKTPEEVGQIMNGTRQKLEALLYLFDIHRRRISYKGCLEQLGWDANISLEEGLCSLQRCVEGLGRLDVGKRHNNEDPDQFISELFERFDEASCSLDDLPSADQFQLSLENVEVLHELEVFHSGDLQKLVFLQEIYGVDRDQGYIPKQLERIESMKGFFQALRAGIFDKELDEGVIEIMRQEPGLDRETARGALIECVDAVVRAGPTSHRRIKTSVELMYLLSQVLGGVASKILALQEKVQEVSLSSGEMLVFKVLKKILLRMRRFYAATDKDDAAFKKIISRRGNKQRYDRMIRDIMSLQELPADDDDTVPPEMENPEDDEFENDIIMD